MQETNTVFFDLLEKADIAFGRLHWSHKVINQTTDFVDSRETSFTAGCSTVVKVILDTGRYHQDSGYSESIAQTKGLAICKAKASSCTNALRRTLLAFEETRTLMMTNDSGTVVAGTSSGNLGKNSTTYFINEANKRKRLENQKILQTLWKKRREENQSKLSNAE